MIPKCAEAFQHQIRFRERSWQLPRLFCFETMLFQYLANDIVVTRNRSFFASFIYHKPFIIKQIQYYVASGTPNC